jgi:hypothetical protein
MSQVSDLSQPSISVLQRHRTISDALKYESALEKGLARMAGTNDAAVERARSLSNIDSKSEKLSYISSDYLDRFPEGGYGWFVVLAAFIINFVIFGYSYSWGVYQSLYLSKVYAGQITTFQLSFVGGITMCLLFIIGPFFGALIRKFGPKKLMYLGTIIQPLGMLLASWVQWVSSSYTHVICSYHSSTCLLIVALLVFTLAHFRSFFVLAMAALLYAWRSYWHRLVTSIFLFCVYAHAMVYEATWSCHRSRCLW